MATKAVSDLTKVINSDDIKLGAMFAELIGVFVLTGAVLATSGNAIIASLTFIIMFLVLTQLSGAHLNPAVTIGLLTAKQISVVKAVTYLIAQALGAMLAFVVITQFMGANSAASSYAAPIFEIPALATTSWLPVWAEVIGALIFGFGVGSVFIGKKQGFDAAFTVGGALMLGLVIPTALGANTVLNPAVAIGASAYSSAWAFLVYLVAPIVGVTLGVLTYKVLLWEIQKGKKDKS